MSRTVCRHIQTPTLITNKWWEIKNIGREFSLVYFSWRSLCSSDSRNIELMAVKIISNDATQPAKFAFLLSRVTTRVRRTQTRWKTAEEEVSQKKSNFKLCTLEMRRVSSRNWAFNLKWTDLHVLSNRWRLRNCQSKTQVTSEGGNVKQTPGITTNRNNLALNCWSTG